MRAKKGKELNMSKKGPPSTGTSPSIPISIPRSPKLPAFALHAKSAPVSASIIPSGNLSGSYVGSPRSGERKLTHQQLLKSMSKQRSEDEDADSAESIHEKSSSGSERSSQEVQELAPNPNDDAAPFFRLDDDAEIKSETGENPKIIKGFK